MRMSRMVRRKGGAGFAAHRRFNQRLDRATDCKSCSGRLAPAGPATNPGRGRNLFAARLYASLSSAIPARIVVRDIPSIRATMVAPPSRVPQPRCPPIAAVSRSTSVGK